jgi:hypothetical protein
MSNRSSFAKFVHSFEISTIFVDVLFVNQNINIIDVFEKFRVRFEFIAHFQQIDIIKKYIIEKNKTFCEIWICIKNDSIILRFTARIVKRSNKKLLIQSMIQFEIFFSCRVSIWHVTLCRKCSLRSDSAEWSFDSFFVFIRCESVRWKFSKSFQLIHFFDISWTCWAVIDESSLFTKSFCSWWISEFFRWCLITRSIDTFSKSCNLFYRFSSMWWCWLSWTILNDIVVCKQWITKWATASWWKHKFWAIYWWFRRNSKFYRRWFIWWFSTFLVLLCWKSTQSNENKTISRCR